MSLAVDASPDGRAYRILLMKTSDSLSKRDLVTIKFLCSDIIGASRLECIKNGIGIWTELENRCLMSCTDYSLLVELLYHSERLDLIRQLTNTNPRDVGTWIKMGQSRLTPFRVFLCQFCKQIPQRELETIKYILAEELSNSAREGAADIWTLLLLLERSDLLGPSQLEYLHEITNCINRPDLQEMICQYKTKHQDVDMLPYDEEKLMQPEDRLYDSTTPEPSSYDSQTNTSSDYGTSRYHLLSSGSEADQNGHHDAQTSNSDYTSSQQSEERFSSPIQETGTYSESSSASEYTSGTSAGHGLLQSSTEISSSASGDDIHMDQTQGSAHNFASHGSSNTGNAIAEPFSNPAAHNAVPTNHIRNQNAEPTNHVTHEHQFRSSMGIETPPYGENVEEAFPSHPLQSDVGTPQATEVTQLQHLQLGQGASVGSSREMLAQADDNDNESLLELPSYKMNATPRGYCFIINNEKFEHVPGDKLSKKLESRPGSEVDAAKLEEEFSRLGFQVIRYPNCSEEKMERIFKTATSGKELEKHDAIIVCVLSHGKMGTVYDARGYEIKIGQIVGHFKPDKCPALAKKPKMFFIQACQGKAKQQVSSVSKLHTDDATAVEDDELPKDADFFIGYATVPGYVSYRHEDDGSWYINKLVDSLHKYSTKYDLLSIMTEVNRGVAKQSAKEGNEVYKQMPLPYSTLTKKIFLTPPTKP